MSIFCSRSERKFVYMALACRIFNNVFSNSKISNICAKCSHDKTALYGRSVYHNRYINASIIHCERRKINVALMFVRQGSGCWIVMYTLWSDLYAMQCQHRAGPFAIYTRLCDFICDPCICDMHRHVQTNTHTHYTTHCFHYRAVLCA